MLKAIRFRVQNFRNIDDSDWIPIEQVTTFVGRNESGKTALLKALHKFHPAIPEPYNPQRDFPRDRYTRDFKDSSDWPVCTVAFEIIESLRAEIKKLMRDEEVPKEAICTRYYDGSLKIEFEPIIADIVISPDTVVRAFDTLAAAARRLEAPNPDQEDATQQLRTNLASWASEAKQRLKLHDDLRSKEGITLLSTLRSESESHATPQTAGLVEELQTVVDSIIESTQELSVTSQSEALIKGHLPVFIYFENYGILDSAIYLTQFLEDLGRIPNDPRIRTINAMFKHVSLTAQEIAELGIEQAQQARTQNHPVTPEMIAHDQHQKEARAIKLNSASLDITNRFNNWYGQRRHTIDYQADGDYFRVWVADDRRPGVKIELEGRSKGFQWFFSFYLVFLVESEEGHKDAILLLDEPGLHLHPTAQQELIKFFEKLSEGNQLIYTTHSPFLIDGEHLHRVRPVTEDDSGHSRVSTETWPKDRETIFPLQAAAGYAMVRGLFQHRKNILVEGISDYYYLHALSHQCARTDRTYLPEDIYITPCGGTKLVGQLASLFLGQSVRPIVLLDGDDAARVRRDALMKELYSGHKSAILMLDEVLGRSGRQVEIEDVFGEDILVPTVTAFIRKPLQLNASDRMVGSLPDQIKAAAKRRSIELPAGWKASVAIRLVSEWDKNDTILPDSVLDVAEALFDAIQQRFTD
ncbi:MAG TPA: hypothetical protein ENI68_05195 [Gammaproteobacteria bacterium]|nr:hypothetical protein [Gammaproteobacteria bacterium]